MVIDVGVDGLQVSFASVLWSLSTFFTVPAPPVYVPLDAKPDAMVEQPGVRLIDNVTCTLGAEFTVLSLRKSQLRARQVKKVYFHYHWYVQTPDVCVKIGIDVEIRYVTTRCQQHTHAEKRGKLVGLVLVAFYR